MSLDKPDVTPVDTHVLQIARSKYLPHLTKSLTDKTYREIQQHFKHMYGSHAGWAHSVSKHGSYSPLTSPKLYV